MPSKPKHPCGFSGCPELIEAGESYCKEHKRERNKRQDRERGSSYERAYDNRWKRARKIFLSENPLCVECMKEGKLIEATVIDHRIPHKGNYSLFWNKDNWQSLCKYHHDVKTAKEDGGFGREIK